MLTVFLYFRKNNNQMQELLIRYSDSRNLEVLTDLAKYFDYEISPAIDLNK